MSVNLPDLRRARDYLDSLRTATMVADRTPLDCVDVGMLGKLAAKEPELVTHVDALLEAADELELSGEYVTEVNDEAETVRTALKDIGIGDTEPLTIDEKEELYAAASTLYDCANGLLEDIGAERSG